MEPVVLIGGGGHAGVLVDLIESLGIFEIRGIVDKNIERGSIVHGLEVLGNDSVLESIFRSGIVNACLAIGSVKNNEPRKILYEMIVQIGFQCPSFVHPTAIIADGVLMGNGVQIMAGAILQRGVRIGNNSIINTGSIVDHDCVIGDHVHIGPGAAISGGCRIGKGAFIGVGSTIVQGINVGDNALVTAGSVVLKDVGENQKVKGFPG